MCLSLHGVDTTFDTDLDYIGYLSRHLRRTADTGHVDI